MTLLVKILLITSSYFPNNGNLVNHFSYFNPNYILFEIISSPAEDSLTENLIPSSNNEAKSEKEINFKQFNPNVVQKLRTTSLQIHFIYRLLPFLIDQPPPSC